MSQLLAVGHAASRESVLLQHNVTDERAVRIMVTMTNVYHRRASPGSAMIRSALLLLSVITSNLFAFEADAQCSFEAGPRLVASDGTSGDVFGLSGAIDSDVMAIGAIWDDDHGFNSGAVYVFVLDNKGVWSETFRSEAFRSGFRSNS